MNDLEFEKQPVIVITIDTDWTPRECLDDTISILDSFGIQASIFATNDMPTEAANQHEIGIHPNFQGRTQNPDDIRNVISECLEFFPNAKGMRSHALVNSTRHYFVIRDHFRQVTYTSNYYLPYVDHLKPMRIQSEAYELPIYWMDHLHIETAGNVDKDNLMKKISKPGLKIFDFHPFHIFINSRTRSHFEAAKNSSHEPSRLLEFRESGAGARMFLKFLLSACKENGWKTLSCQNVIHQFANTKTGTGFDQDF